MHFADMSGHVISNHRLVKEVPIEIWIVEKKPEKNHWEMFKHWEYKLQYI